MTLACVIGALARRSGVLAGDAVVAAETEVGERAEAVTHGEGALRGAMTQALAKVELLRCGGVDVGMDVDALEQGEQQTIRALIAAVSCVVWCYYVCCMCCY